MSDINDDARPLNLIDMREDIGLLFLRDTKYYRIPTGPLKTLHTPNRLIGAFSAVLLNTLLL